MIDLINALRLDGLPRVALVGAGGKTTVLFKIARGLLGESQVQHMRKPAVFVTATTHLAVEQIGLADWHYMLEKSDDLAFLEEALLPGVLLFTGPLDGKDRTLGLDSPVLDRLLARADAYHVPLLIEADGSRQRPLKAPAEHEPAIPAFVDTVIVVVGLSGLGKPLTEEWVHRPERFAALSGLEPGEQIQPDALCRLLLSPKGGLKNIPTSARRVALLNQADTPELQIQAKGMARNLLVGFHSVVIASLQPAGHAHGLREDEIEGAPVVYNVHEAVAGILLAAGGSKRYGSPKQLLPWRDQPMVRHVVQIALQAGLTPVVVVTGAYPSEVEAAIKDLPVVVAYNPDWEQGQSTSLQAGLRLLSPNTGAAIFLLSDQPQVPVNLIEALVELHSTTLSPIVVPQVNGRRGNPVLFDRISFHELNKLSGDVGGRALVTGGSGYTIAWLPWHDPDLLLDVDEPGDYEQLLRRSGADWKP